MKVKALITIVVGKGVEVAPNELVDVSEFEAKKLIDRGFAEEVAKPTASRSRNTNQNKSNLPPPPEEDEEPEDDEQGEDDDNPDEQSGQQPV